MREKVRAGQDATCTQFREKWRCETNEEPTKVPVCQGRDQWAAVHDNQSAEYQSMNILIYATLISGQPLNINTISHHAWMSTACPFLRLRMRFLLGTVDTGYLPCIGSTTLVFFFTASGLGPLAILVFS